MCVDQRVSRYILGSASYKAPLNRGRPSDRTLKLFHRRFALTHVSDML